MFNDYFIYFCLSVERYINSIGGIYVLAKNIAVLPALNVKNIETRDC